jgi:hypothetical protein
MSRLQAALSLLAALLLLGLSSLDHTGRGEKINLERNVRLSCDHENIFVRRRKKNVMLYHTCRKKIFGTNFCSTNNFLDFLCHKTFFA